MAGYFFARCFVAGYEVFSVMPDDFTGAYLVGRNQLRDCDRFRE
jgi:hypothetical protein